MAASDSVRWQVALAVGQALNGIGYVGLYDVTGPSDGAQGTTVLPVRVTAEATPDKMTDPIMSLIVVSEPEMTPDAQFNEPGAVPTMHTPYPLLVIFLQNRGHQPEQGQLEANVREIVRLRLFTPGALDGLLGGSTQPQNFNIGYDPRPGLPDSLWGPNFKATAQRFTFVVSERRANVGGY